jgi:aldehyde dehydrogenase
MPDFPVDESLLRKVVEDVLARLGEAPAAPPPTPPPRAPAAPAVLVPAGRRGVFGCANEAAEAAAGAFQKLRRSGVDGRARVVEIVKSLCLANAAEWGRFELEETRIGRLDHKIEKLQIIRNVPGVEWLRPDAMSGDGGITLEEFAPFGVVGAILPVTHSVPTLSGNIVNMVAAGNAVVFNPHPGGARSAALAIDTYNAAIERETGIANLICTVEKPTLESFDALCKSPHVGLLAITGGPAVVAAAMKSGKRAICAGPGNPPVVVDETADVRKAARDIVKGSAYDNNLLCIGEKQVFVVDKVFKQFMDALEEFGGFPLTASQAAALAGAAFTNKPDAGGCSHPVLNRELVGRDPAVLAKHAGVNLPAGVQLLFAETAAGDAFVQEEQMMPMLPVVRVRDFDEAVAGAVASEHGYRHSAIIHSRNVDRMTTMARAIDTTLFVKNGPCVAGLGLGGEGYLSYSIATTTGEGITTPKTFTRVRRCVMVENLRII